MFQMLAVGRASGECSGVMWRRSGVHERAFTNEVDDAFGYKANIQEQAEIAMRKNDAFCLARYARKIASYKKVTSLCKVRKLSRGYSSPSSNVSEKLMRDVKVSGSSSTPRLSRISSSTSHEIGTSAIEP
jgi:hypothetical protein